MRSLVSKITLALVILITVSSLMIAAENNYNVLVFVGDVSVLVDKTTWIKPKIGMKIEKDNWIKTGSESWLKIKVSDEGIIEVTENSFIKFADLVDKSRKKEIIDLFGIKSKLLKLSKRKTAGAHNYMVLGVRGDEQQMLQKKTGFTWAESIDECNELLSSAFSSFSNKKYNLAIVSGKKFIDSCPGSKGRYKIISVIAHSYQEIAQFKKSNEYFKKIINKSTNKLLLEESNFMTAMNYNYLEDYDKALVAFENYIKNYSKGKYITESVFMTGLTYEAKGDIKKANAYYKRIVKDFSDYTELYNICK